jgi:hypothetical protein
MWSALSALSGHVEIEEIGVVNVVIVVIAAVVAVIAKTVEGIVDLDQSVNLNLTTKLDNLSFGQCVMYYRRKAEF